MQLQRIALLVLFACNEKSPAPAPPPKPARVPLACGEGTVEKNKPWRQQVSPNVVYTEGEQAWCEKPDGKRHGPLRVTYASGKRAVEGAYVDGLREGPWTIWYGDADRGKATEETWKNGQRHGTWRSYRPDAANKLWGETEFVDGKAGTWFEYDEQGTKREVASKPPPPPIDE